MYPVIDKERTGKRLKGLMELNGLSPKDIQCYLSLSCVQTVYRWLEGTNIPSIDNLYALSQLFQTGMDEMIAGNRKMSVINPDSAVHRRVLLYRQLAGEYDAA